MKLRILHSFPVYEDKFKVACSLLFTLDNISNTYVSNLSNSINIRDFDLIILHYLRYEDSQFLMENKIDVPVIWFFWGGDIFNNGKFYNTFLLHKTICFRRKLHFRKGFINGVKHYIKEIMPWIIDLTQINRYKLDALNKIDYVITVVPDDYDLLKKKYNFNAKHFHLNYGNPLVESDIIKIVNGKNILLGNSSSFTNNYFEAIDKLSILNLDDRKVIIPLSYGDKIFAEFVADYALKKLGVNKVNILKDFIPFSDYNDLLLTCEIVIMNHKRQQAVGNIVQSLVNGAHIYLRSESTVYQYLKDCGFKISAFNGIRSLSNLSYEDILLNRGLAKKIFGIEVQQKNLKMLINEALGEKFDINQNLI